MLLFIQLLALVQIHLSLFVRVALGNQGEMQINVMHSNGEGLKNFLFYYIEYERIETGGGGRGV